MVHFYQRLHDKSRTTGKINDESSSLKLDYYLFSSAEDEQQQDHRKLTVEEKKVGFQ